jgi:hypothetical protein
MQIEAQESSALMYFAVENVGKLLREWSAFGNTPTI